jgi:uncharacterized protein YcbK (DUF882 family)
MGKQVSKPINYFQISEHFYLREFQSPDTEEVKIYPEVVERLEKLRAYVNKPILIHSAYRTPEHNKKVGGVKNSYHCQGMAVDVSSLGVSLDELKKYALAVGFKGIGIYRNKNFIHLDIGPERSWEE